MNIYDENGILKVNNVLKIPLKIKESKIIIGNYDSVLNYTIVDVLKKFDRFSIVENYSKKKKLFPKPAIVSKSESKKVQY